MLAAVLAAGAAAAWFAGAVAPLDWQPPRAWREPWRAWTAAAVHYSPLHLGANLFGTALVAALGWSARVSRSVTRAWLCAWPLTQLGLVLRPDLSHYGGLSGVLHAGVAVVAVHLLATGPRTRRAVGAALVAGLSLKVGAEAPWGPALRLPAGWDIATAPFAHASGVAAGLVCATVAVLVAGRHGRAPTMRADD